MIDLTKTPRCPVCDHEYIHPREQIRGPCRICEMVERNDVSSTVDTALDDVFDFVTDSEEGR